MKTILFTFSATGNSLTTARLLAEAIGNCSIVGISSLRDQKTIPVAADAVGFVFPVYYGDMPCLMRSVIARMQFTAAPYIFAIPTYRGHYGASAQRLDALLHTLGQKLSCSLPVRLPGNSRISTPEQNAELLAAQKDSVAAVAEQLRAFPVEDFSAQPMPEPSPVHSARNMRGMTAEDNCIGCGLCTRVCPMDNIRIADGKALISDNCSSCMACFHWCPQKAIWMPLAEEEIRRRFQYRHPDVTVQDIIALKHK